MQPLALLMPSLMHFSPPQRLCQVHSLQLSFNEDSILLVLGKPSGNLGTNYYARNQLLARNRLATLSAPHQRCQHHIKGAPMLTEDLKGLTMLMLFLSPMLMLFLRPPPLCQVHSHQSSRHYHSEMTVAKQAWHDHLPY